jgi:cobalt-zinc-cadmium efflux system outer membrane protein
MRLQAGLRPNPSLSVERREERSGPDNQTLVNVEWPLDLFRRDSRIAVADREIATAGLAVADRARLLAADVRASYGEVLAAVRELSLLEELVAAARRQHGLLRSRVEEGASPPLERDLLDVELRRLEADCLLQLSRAERAMFELKRILGMPPTDSLRLRETLEDVVNRESAMKVAPQFGISPSGASERVHGLFHYVAGGAMVRVPLFNRNQGEIATTRAERAGATAVYEAVRLSAQAEIAAAQALDRRAHEALQLYVGGARTLARQNLTVVGQIYELGRTTVFEVLAEQRRFLEVERGYTGALRSAYEARTTLKRALGEVP